VKLYYYKAPEGNFGDDLNPWLWPRLLPGLFDNDDHILFIGIGTILNDRIPEQSLKVVFGSGVGDPKKAPKLNEKWKILALRGPLSARLLEVSPKLAVTDPAVLVRLFSPPSFKKIYRVSYIPHFKSANFSQWEEVAGGAGLHYIDPRAGVEVCLQHIAQAELLITEAMHGAIVADALRVPWIIVRANNYFVEKKMYRFKWDDWRFSLRLPSRSYTLLPLWGRREDETAFVRWKRRVKEKWIVSRLRRIRRTAHPCLSRDQTLNTAVARYQEILEQFKKSEFYV